jgi:UDPglucose 6-dehydrogenase
VCSPRTAPPENRHWTQTSHVIKHACNAFLAMKVSFINSVANVWELILEKFAKA